MSTIIKSNDMKWLDASDVFYNDIKPEVLFSQLEEVLKDIHSAQECVNNVEGLSPFICTITNSDIELIIENLRRFVYFSNGIHYEISEWVDTPFSIKMGDLAGRIIDLDPSDYKYVKSKFLCFKDYMSLTDLVKSTITDDDLKESFYELALELDEDEASYELQDSIKEANWWQEQFVMAEEIDKATDELFTPEVRARWTSMSSEERDSYIQEYKEILEKIYFNGESKVPSAVEYLVPYYDNNGKLNQPGFGLANPFPYNYVGINEKFKTEPEGMYSLDKMIDTMTHEMRHRYQDLDDTLYTMPDSIRREWHMDYITSDDYDKYYKQPVEEDAKAFAALAHDDKD